ncbi:cytochrome C [Geobacter sp. DSM 9736]|uniref:cytochrome C n=1 Tax=Geobacter sp. DSM 9736 TaxID=1277350 RepID=UPI000B50539C|nr:cytochrome C [Geobacter sp. DSM 9736]SNB45275.1 hypothetical protein SAMN06269301_0682 [Geobacter sp. DSM 9736]
MHKVLLLMFVTLMISMPVTGEETPPGSQVTTYPHNDSAKCDLCHEATEEDLKSWFTFSSTKKKMRLDYNEVCWQCHDIDFGHGVGKSPKKNRENLPLDAEGKITCAITCHNMHIKTSEQHQNKFHLRFSHMKLCLSCHDR